MKFKNIISTLLICGTLASLTSCARQISSDMYAAPCVGEASVTYAGVIRNVREVCVDGSDQLEGNQMGLFGGGAAGGIAGSAIGRGGLLPTAAGAVVGAVGGAMIEKKLKRQAGLEYIVQLENGGLMTVVQGADQVFAPGQLVYVVVGQSGRSRITPQVAF